MIPLAALRPARFVVLAAVALVLLAALAPVGARGATSVTIRIGSTLSPAVVTVAPGTPLVWVNNDGERHRVRSRGPVEFDSGNIEPGRSWSVTLTTEGTYAYLDDRDRENTAYHGQIVVSDTPSSESGGSGGGSGSGGGTGSGTGGTGGTSTSPATATVSIGDGTFAPSTVSVAVGGSVTWRNGDDRDHTATARGGGFDTGSLASGQAATERFPSAGTFAYLCAIHPDMQGTVRVVAAGTAAPPPPPAAAPKPTPPPSAPPPVDGLAPGVGGSAADPTVALSIVDLAFAPGSASVAAGTTVTWTNDGVAPHTVTAVDDAFDSGMLNAGATWTRLFDQAGTFRFSCAVHPDMVGVLTVTARTGSAASPSATAPPDAIAPDAANAETAIDGDGLPRAAVTLLACLVAVAFFGRLVRGVARD